MTPFDHQNIQMDSADVHLNVPMNSSHHSWSSGADASALIMLA